jgi:mono/diheme cytochrome c family protein
MGRYPRHVLVGRVKRFLPYAAVAAFLVVAAGCGGAGAAQEATSDGAHLFNSAGCADCHALTAAGARARVGPDLDALQPSYVDVADQVRQGGGGMPAFSDKLTEQEIAAIATFVASATGGSTDPNSAASAAQFSPDGTKIADCDGGFTCLEQAFGNLTYEKGSKPALAEFDRLMASDPEVERNCHRIAHMMGAAALVRYDGRVGKAFAEGSASCWSGYYHGILERAYSDVEPDELGTVSRGLCSDADVRETAFIAYQCVHGLGHGLMLYTSYDLPKSLEICDQLETSWDQTSCTGGVFMENISSSYGIESKWLRDDDPLYPCQTVAERHKLYCYLMVTSRILSFVDYDFQKAADWCRKSEDAWVATCFQSLGRDASGTTRGSVSEILRICGLGGDMETECVYGAARDLTSNDGGPKRSAGLCQKAAARLQDYCFEGIGTILGGLYATTTERRSSCAVVSPREAFRSACRNGAGVGP